MAGRKIRYVALLVLLSGLLGHLLLGMPVNIVWLLVIVSFGLAFVGASRAG